MQGFAIIMSEKGIEMVCECSKKPTCNWSIIIVVQLFPCIHMPLKYISYVIKPREAEQKNNHTCTPQQKREFILYNLAWAKLKKHLQQPLGVLLPPIPYRG
jgi:hypothetical protein